MGNGRGAGACRCSDEITECHNESVQCVKYNAIFNFHFAWCLWGVLCRSYFKSTRLVFHSWMNWLMLPMSPGVPRVQRAMEQHGAMFCSNQYTGPLATLTINTPAMWPSAGDAPSATDLWPMFDNVWEPIIFLTLAFKQVSLEVN